MGDGLVETLTVPLNATLIDHLISPGTKSSVLNRPQMRPKPATLKGPGAPIDNESVRKHSKVKGMYRSVFCLVHEKSAEMPVVFSDLSKPYEFEMALALACHLLFQGYHPSQIIILSSYVRERVSIQSINNRHSGGVRMMKIGDYRGESSDIIIVSLVPSNDPKHMSVHRLESQVCVALSRAKQGFYLIGDMAVLKSRSELWIRNYRMLQSQGQVGPAFPLMCEIHGTITLVKQKSEFPSRGGCKELCKERMACGHVCRKRCHVYDRNHLVYRCAEKCLRFCPVGHPNWQMCYEQDKLCLVKVKKLLPCGHSKIVDCYKRLRSEVCVELCWRKCPFGHPCFNKCREKCQPCRVKVNRVLPCGHWSLMECSADPQLANCLSRVEIELPCKHIQQVECYKKDKRRICNEPCSRSCAEGHPCRRTCYEYCGPCRILVKRQLPCGHLQVMECYRDPRKQSCLELCTRYCPNGHPSSKRCYEQFLPCHTKMIKALPCGHSKVVECCNRPDGHYCYISVTALIIAPVTVLACAYLIKTKLLD